MGILVECPDCHNKQSKKNKKCKCGRNLDAAKKAKKVRYWIDFTLPDGKARRESVGSFKGLNAYSIKDAEKANSKRVVQRAEKRILDMLPESEITFSGLADWYFKLKKVKRLSSVDRIELAVTNFNKVFGSRKVGSIKLNDLEDYQITREDEDRAPATIDYELSVTKTMVTTAFDNDKVSGDALKPFRAVKRKCKKFSNARDRVVSVDEYVRLLDEAPRHLKLAIVLSYTTGMRKGEIRNLRWSHVDKKVGLILLTGDETKEGKAKAIPLNEHVLKAMTALPRGLRCQYVVQYKGKRIASKEGMKRSFVTACKEAKIPYGRKAENGITFHDLRRSAKTNMAKAGVPKAFRDAILGHASQDMDRHYLKLTGEDLIPMMDRYIDWLDAEISNLDHFLDQEAKKDSGTTPKSLSVASL